MPRILTNKSFLPDPFVRAVSNDKYKKRGDISITTLIDSPRVSLLKKNHKYEEDVSQNVWALFGTAVHAVIERANEDHHGVENEVPLTMMIDGWEVTGTADMYEEEIETLTDWKVTSVWKVIRGISDTDSWTKQTNCYAAMLRAQGKKVSHIHVIAILKDWKARESLYNPDYPAAPVVRIKIKVFSQEGMIKYMHDRVKLHKEQANIFYFHSDDTGIATDGLAENKIPICTPEERWRTPTTWKMKTAGKARSLKNFPINSKEDEAAAIEYHAKASMQYPDLKIEKELGVDKRCSEFCPVNVHCSYWQIAKDYQGKG